MISRLDKCLQSLCGRPRLICRRNANSVKAKPSRFGVKPAR